MPKSSYQRQKEKIAEQKREILTLHQQLRELVLYPFSAKSTTIKLLVETASNTENAYWSGSRQKPNEDGTFTCGGLLNLVTKS